MTAIQPARSYEWRFATIGAACISGSAVCKTALSTAFALIALAGVSLLCPVSALGAEPQYPGLSDGLDILSAFRTAHPEAERAYQELMKRVPEEVRKQAEASDWAQRQAAMNPAQLEEAASDRDMRLVPTPDGVAAISSDKLTKAIRGLVEFAVDQNDIAQLLAPIRDKLPASLQGAAGAILSQLPLSRDSPAIRWVAVAGIEKLVATEVASQIDPVSEEIRDGVFRDGPSAALAKARQEADAMKKRAAEAAAALSAAEAAQAREREARAKEEAAKAPAVTPGSDQDRLAALKASIGQDLGTIEAFINQVDPLEVASCQSARKATQVVANLNEALSRRALIHGLIRESITRVDRFAGSASSAVRLVTITREAADKVCPASAGRSDSAALQRLEAMLGIVQGAYDGISGQIRSTLVDIGDPVAQPDESLRQSARSVAETCGDFDIRRRDVLRKTPIGPYIAAVQRIGPDLASAEALAGLGDLELQLHKTQWARLQGAIQKLESYVRECVDDVGVFRKFCSAANTADLLKRVESAYAEAAALEADRIGARGRLTKTMEELERDYTAAKNAIEQAKACVSRKADDVSVEPTRPHDCEQSRNDLAEAKSLADKGSLAAALEALDKIKVEQCPDLGPQVAAERTRISGLVDNAVNNAEAALDACSKFSDSRNLIGELPVGPRRAALVERWNNAYEAERRARDFVTEAMALRDQGEPGKAIGKLHQARDLTSCDSTVAAIDKAIAGMQSAAAASAEDKIAAATASCRRDFGGGYRAGVPLPDDRYSCVPDQATANAKCDQLNNATGYEAINIKNDGSFGCRMGKVAADNWCRGQRGAGWYAQFNKDRSRVTCYPDRNARTAQCVTQFGAGWRAGDLRADGRWTCYGPRRQTTTPRPQPGVQCPPGQIPTESGGCLNLGGIMEGIGASVRGLPGGTRPSGPTIQQAPTIQQSPAIRRPPTTSGRPPAPTCPDRRCQMKGARYVNGQWIGGVCVCPKSVF